MFKFIRKLFYRKERMDALVRYNNGERIPTDPYRLYYDNTTGRFYVADPEEIQRAFDKALGITRVKPDRVNVTRRKP